MFFLISTQNIDCGYSLEPPRRGGSNEYPQSMFLSSNKKNKKNNVYPYKPQFYYINYIGMFSWCAVNVPSVFESLKFHCMYLRDVCELPEQGAKI